MHPSRSGDSGCVPAGVTVTVRVCEDVNTVRMVLNSCNICDSRLNRNEKDVCFKCSYQELLNNAPLMCEVLMYAEFHRKSATKEKLVNLMCGFFTDDELKSGKSILYDRFGDRHVLQNDVA